jgi:hypothetical protein
MKYQPYIAIFLAICCALSAGCNSVDTSDEIFLRKGTCIVNIHGYFNKTFYGKAVFENVPGLGGHTLFFLELTDITIAGVDYRYVEFQGGSKPNAGTYNLINEEDSSNSTKGIMIGWYNDSGVAESFDSIGGTIVISHSDDKVLKGRADFPAIANISTGKGQSIRAEITITVEFNAEEGKTGIILDKKSK